MSENIYQDQIVEWSKKAGHLVKLEHAQCRATASNPLCGDRISVELEFDGDVIKSISCQVKGCILCKASGSVLVELARGLIIDQLKVLSSELEAALNPSNDDPDSFPERYRMFFPVRKHKSRRSCVLLPFEAVFKAVSEFKRSSLIECGKPSDL